MHGLVDSEQIDERGSYVGQPGLRYVGQTERFVITHQDERHARRRMGRERTRPVIGEHLVGVAVICRDERGAALGENRLDHMEQSVIDCLDRSGRSLDHARVANHVAVGVVDDVDIGRVIVNRLLERLGDEWFGHFGLQIVGRDLGTGDELALLPLLGLLNTAVEEEGDMGVLLGLRDVELVQALQGKQVCQGVFRERLGKGDRRIDSRIVFGEADEVDIGRGKPSKSLSTKTRVSSRARSGRKLKKIMVSPSLTPRWLRTVGMTNSSVISTL